MIKLHPPEIIRFSDGFRGNKRWLIHLNLLNIRKKNWQWHLNVNIAKAWISHFIPSSKCNSCKTLEWIPIALGTIACNWLSKILTHRITKFSYADVADMYKSEISFSSRCLKRKFHRSFLPPFLSFDILKKNMKA